MKKNKVLIIIGIAVLVTGATFAVYHYRKKKTSGTASASASEKYPSLVTTKSGTQIKEGTDIAAADVIKYDQAGTELMVTDTKVIEGTTWYNVLDYVSMAEGWVLSTNVDFKI